MPHLFLLLLLFVVLPSNLSAQSYTNISLGTTFSPVTHPTFWPSPSGDFAFGFHALESDPTLFLLAVWFDKCPNKTVVWVANRDNPVTSGSTAKLAFDGQLSLVDTAGQQIWSSNNTAAASYASILDNGNLVLATSDSSTIWQTFDNPTDTILPGQILNQGMQMYAKLLDDDYSRGRFELTLQPDGNLVMYPVGYPTAITYPAYWAASIFGTGIQLVYDQLGALYMSFSNGTQHSVLPAPAVNAQDNYLRLTLDTDGILRQYSFPKDNLTSRSWTVRSILPSESCDINFAAGSGACGANSYCVSGPDGRSNCQCPPHYSLIDPIRTYKGCSSNFITQSCEPGGEASFSLNEVVNAFWPLGDSDEHFSPMNQTECTDNCLKDCFCSAAVYNDGNCWKKRFPLMNGKGGSDSNRTVFVKYSTVMEENSAKSTFFWGGYWRIWVVVVGSVILGASVILNLVLGFKKRNMLDIPIAKQENRPLFLRPFTYKELKLATKGFSEHEVLGKGGFGTVYKGVLSSTQPKTFIAVKELHSLSEEAEKDFENELMAIAQTHHKNLVKLIGFCKEKKTHRFLVFEFISNGSLDRTLFTSNRPEWNQRIKIALGIAEGLLYLHEECTTQIIHCDIKPQNILLDDNMEARISDFGISKLLKLDQTWTSTCPRGSKGYLAPEWLTNDGITRKVDVYSFGVVLLEIICCRRNFDLGPDSTATVIVRARECLRNGRLDLLVEEDDEAKSDGMRLERFVLVGISCLQEEPWLRPSMKKVVQMLEGVIAVHLPPNMFPPVIPSIVSEESLL